MFRKLSLLVALLGVLVLTSSAQAATIWHSLPSGTTGTISSVVYQSSTRLWYATTAGRIAFWNGSGFTAGTGITPGEDFVDLAFQPTSVPGRPGTAGLYGYAVAANGDIWQSADGGKSWTKVVSPITPSDCSSFTPITETELNAVRWANGTTLYLLGNSSTILRATNANTGSPTFNEVNKVATGTCSVQNETFTENLTDATFLPANPANALFVAQDFGRIYQSSNALGGIVTGSNVNTDTVNNFQGNPRIARDAGNPNRLWIVDHQPDGTGCGSLCLELSTNGGSTTTTATFANDSHPAVALYGISSLGGVEVTAGSGGEIFTSKDGTHFYLQRAGGTLATANWRAEAAFDAGHAAVGGENGALAITAAANTLPDLTPPKGRISGPTTVTSGQATKYTAVVSDNAGGRGVNRSSFTWAAPGLPTQHGATATYTFPRGSGVVTLRLSFADNAGNRGSATLHVTVKNAPPPGPPTGSSPVTTTANGATIKIFKVVTVTGRDARYVPVVVSATKPRKFVARVLALTAKPKVLAVGRLSLSGKHGGHGTIHIQLPAAIRPGSYFISVRQTTLGGKTVGKVLKFKFTLK